MCKKPHENIKNAQFAYFHHFRVYFCDSTYFNKSAHEIDLCVIFERKMLFNTENDNVVIIQNLE